MNAGLSNLATLRRHLLAQTMLSDTTFDTVITQIGLGVAGALEKYCNRKFLRTVADTATFSADRASLILPRFPVEGTPTVEHRANASDAFTTLSDVIQQLDANSGLVQFAAPQGDYLGLLRLTFTGGYYWDTTEDDTGTLPSGATALPKELQTAWLLQCEAVWAARDKLGTGLIEEGEKKSIPASLFGMEIIPLVKEMLAPFKRYQMS